MTISLRITAMAFRAPKVPKIKPYLTSFMTIEHPFREMSVSVSELAENFGEELKNLLLLTLHEASEEIIKLIKSDPTWPSEIAERLIIWVEDDGVVVGLKDGEEAFRLETGDVGVAPSPIFRNSIVGKKIEESFKEHLNRRLAEVFNE